MRRPLPSSASPSSKGKSIPAPVGGWNARDALANMPATDAIFLDNFFPRTNDIMLRKGSVLFATLPADTQPLSPHDVRSLMVYKATDGTSTLFAVTQDGIYDATAGGTITVVDSVVTSHEWQYTNITTAGGSFLWCCNGVDKSRYFNGTAWTVLDGTSTPALTGVTSADVVNVHLHKSRLYLCVKESLSFFYLPVNSVAGAASEFPLGAIFRRGGYIVATESLTIDGGNGPEDYFVALTSEGECALYSGTDPANAATWALQGVYYIGAPVGRRCMVKFGGDVAILTVQGLSLLSRRLNTASIGLKSAISDKISRAWVDYTEQGKSYYGWQPIVFPEGPFLLVNVPVLSDQSAGNVYSYQFVMNTQTTAWCRFTNMPAEVWATMDGRLFYALHNKVYEAWTGSVDARGPIDGRVKTAFMYPAGRGTSTHIKLVRPIFETSTTNLRLQLGIDTDYNEASIAFSAISYQNGVAYWDTAEWDESYWTASRVVAKWRTVNHHPGHAISLRLRVLGKDITMSWNATDFILQKGGLF